jgi:chaperonin cofactor prefoldin
MGSNKIYKKVTKPLKKLREIENKISKGYMTNDKVQALLNQHEAIENELKNSPEYRIYLFKKKHGLLKLS